MKYPLSTKWMENSTHVYEILEFFWQREHQEMSLPCLSLQVGKNYFVLIIIIYDLVIKIIIII